MCTQISSGQSCVRVQPTKKTTKKIFWPLGEKRGKSSIRWRNKRFMTILLKECLAGRPRSMVTWRYPHFVNNTQLHIDKILGWTNPSYGKCLGNPISSPTCAAKTSEQLDPWFHVTSPQLSAVQASTAPPVHPAPPCAACTFTPRFRSCVPPPQPLVHLDGRPSPIHERSFKTMGAVEVQHLYKFKKKSTEKL